VSLAAALYHARVVADPSFPPFRRLRLTAPGRGGGDVAALDFGPPDRPFDAVFLHANGFNALTYRRLLEPLGARWRILAFDQRGHGGTTLAADPEGRRDWLDHRDDLLAILDVLRLDAPVLAGHSLGGAVSVLAAAQRPSCAARLVLLDPVMFPWSGPTNAGESPMVKAALRRRAVFASRAEALGAYRGRGAFATWPEVTLRDYLEDGLVDQPDGAVRLACAPAWEASSYAAQDNDTWGALAAWAGPVDMLLAQSGSTCRFPEGEEVTSLPPRIGASVLAGTTHFLPMERPDDARRLLAHALEQRASGAQG
jgi:pimeloyl-ACP methyl ester carboxylesterase